MNSYHHDWIEIIYLIHGELEVQINNETLGKSALSVIKIYQKPYCRYQVSFV